MDTKLSLILDKLKPVGSDENLKVYALEDGIIIGIWRVNILLSDCFIIFLKELCLYI